MWTLLKLWFTGSGIPSQEREGVTVAEITVMSSLPCQSEELEPASTQRSSEGSSTICHKLSRLYNYRVPNHGLCEILCKNKTTLAKIPQDSWQEYNKSGVQKSQTFDNVARAVSTLIYNVGNFIWLFYFLSCSLDGRLKGAPCEG